MDAGRIPTMLKEYREQLQGNCFNQKDVGRLFEKESPLTTAVRWVFGFDSAKYDREWLPKRCIRKIFRSQEPRAIERTRLFIKCLDDLEQIPVQFGMDKKNIDFQPWIIAAKKISDWASNSGCKTLESLGQKIEQRRIAIFYRIEGENDGADKNKEPQDSEGLILLAKEWNLKQFNAKSTDLTEDDLSKIEEVCHYSNFADLLLRSPALQCEFFKWIIRDGNDVASFVEFPGTMDWMGTIVTKRFQGLSKVEKTVQDVMIKALTLPFAGERKNILIRDQIITLENNYKLNFKEIVRKVQVKKDHEEEINFYAPRGLGFTNWYIQNLRRCKPEEQDYDSLDLE